MITNKLSITNKSFFSCYAILTFIYFLPLLIRNIFYADDLSQVVYGWNNDFEHGRLLSGYINQLLGFGSLVVDTAPLIYYFLHYY